MIRINRRYYRASAVSGFIFLALGFYARAQGDDRGGAYYPVEPAQLLAALPPPPENWKLTLSIAKERISYAMEPESIAVRAYHFVPPPPLPDTPPQPPGPPKDVTLTLLDTGQDPERMGSFNNFTPGNDPDSPHLLVQGFEAIQTVNGPMRFLTIKVSDRFLLSSQFNNMKDTEVALWAQHFLQVQKMADASNAAPNVPLKSGNITLPFVDELKPSNDFQSVQSFQNKADLKKLQSSHQ